MNAAELKALLQGGAIIRTRWRNRKIKNELIMKDGSVIYIQQSALDAVIKTGALRSMIWARGHADYFLKEQ